MYGSAFESKEVQNMFETVDASVIDESIDDTASDEFGGLKFSGVLEVRSPRIVFSGIELTGGGSLSPRLI